jgi:hypothetical protein
MKLEDANKPTLEELKQYLPDITQEEFESDVAVDVISCYGGVLCSVIKASEVISFVKNQERVFKIDYIFSVVKK